MSDRPQASAHRTSAATHDSSILRVRLSLQRGGWDVWSDSVLIANARTQHAARSSAKRWLMQRQGGAILVHTRSGEIKSEERVAASVEPRLPGAP